MRRAIAILVGAAIGLGAVALAIQTPGRSPGGSVEGIQVHGAWVIEVRDPDGTVANRVEFQNALDGSARLARLLTGTKAAGPWLVFLHGDASGHPCLIGSTPIQCAVTEPGSGLVAADYVFPTLTLSLVTGGFKLEGTAIAGRTTNIALVQTANIECDPTVTPNACNFSAAGANYSGFTSKALATPVSVVAGQQVLVTVTITFS